MSYQKHDKDFKDEILRLFLEEGRTKQSIADEYGISKNTIDYWLKQYRKECAENPTTKVQADSYEENKRLKQENLELKKEIEFLKKAAAFFAKEIK